MPTEFMGYTLTLAEKASKRDFDGVPAVFAAAAADKPLLVASKDGADPVLVAGEPGIDPQVLEDEARIRICDVACYEAIGVKDNGLLDLLMAREVGEPRLALQGSDADVEKAIKAHPAGGVKLSGEARQALKARARAVQGRKANDEIRRLRAQAEAGQEGE